MQVEHAKLNDWAVSGLTQKRLTPKTARCPSIGLHQQLSHAMAFTHHPTLSHQFGHTTQVYHHAQTSGGRKGEMAMLSEATPDFKHMTEVELRRWVEANPARVNDFRR